MEEVKLPIHEHPLLPITRFSRDQCRGCGFKGYIYGGYRCNELGCLSVFHRECAESLPEIKHSSHPDHPLKLFQGDDRSACSRCRDWFRNGYKCSICDFKLDLRCVRTALILENSNLHQHPIELFSSMPNRDCKTCDSPVWGLCYGCHQCEIVFHVECTKYFPDSNHTSHPQHPLKSLEGAVPDYADEECLLCGIKFDDCFNKFHHCDVCNFSICPGCNFNPPPVVVESPTTHEHQLHLVPRRIDFTCNACGTLGHRSPYFCLQCNFMIHRECIDLPRLININRHDHRISYTRRLGHGEEWKCKVCRKNVDGFYGAYTCVKCPSFAVHSLCATRWDVWEMIELEGMPEEEEEIAPFEVIDDNTIKHFSHDHNLLLINKEGRIQPENIVCEACVLQILSEPFYSCNQCNFVLHEKCANHPRKIRHVHRNLPFTLLTDSRHEVHWCELCRKHFTGFRYKCGTIYGYRCTVHDNGSTVDDPRCTIDVRCAAIADTLEHGSHQHPLYYYATYISSDWKNCTGCGGSAKRFYRCDECDYTLDVMCAHFPNKVMKNRYDDHSLFLSFGEKNVDGDYWCEACETTVDRKEWFYTCNDCGTILHIYCVVGDLSYIMPGSHLEQQYPYRYGDVVSNTSICRPFCSQCNSRCMLPTILKQTSKAGVDNYFCSYDCLDSYTVHQAFLRT